MNILMIGADSAIARLVETQILNDKAFADVKLTMFLRDKSQVTDLLSLQSSVIEGDVTDLKALSNAVEDQDIVFDTLGVTQTTEPTRNIIRTMRENGVVRVVSINDLGIYGEVPGKFGQWNKAMVGKRLEIGQQMATLYENSGLDVTILRLAWLNNESTISYELTSKGELFKGTTVSRQSVANIMLKIIDDPDYLSQENVGVDKPGTDGDTPTY